MYFEYECSLCGDEIYSYQYNANDGLCDDCYLKEHEEEYLESLNFDFAYDHLKDETDKIEIPVVFTWIYKNSEIVDTLIRDAAKIASDKMREYLNDLAHEDNAREWLEDYRKWRAKNAADK